MALQDVLATDKPDEGRTKINGNDQELAGRLTAVESGKAAVGHDHDARYYTETEADARFAPIARGIPPGGTTGQVWAKNSNTDYDAAWLTMGGEGGAVPNASTTVEGIGRVSVAPADASHPVFVGDNDTRNTNTRIPTDGSVTNAKVNASAAIDESKLNLASDAVAGTASRRTLGTGAQQACAGNDPRLTRVKDLVLYNGKTTITNTDETGRYPVVDAGTITRIVAQIVTAPTGAALNITVKKNGSSVHTMSISAGTNTTNSTGLSIAAADGDYFTFAVTQVGSTVAGGQLTVLLREALS